MTAPKPARPNRALEWLADWVIPPTAAAALIGLVWSSPAGFNLWVANGRVAAVLVAAYIAAFVTARLLDSVRFHGIATFLVVVILAGRVAAFVELELGRPRDVFSLWGNILERSWLLALAVHYHGLEVWRIGWRRETPTAEL